MGYLFLIILRILLGFYGIYILVQIDIKIPLGLFFILKAYQGTTKSEIEGLNRYLKEIQAKKRRKGEY